MPRTAPFLRLASFRLGVLYHLPGEVSSFAVLTIAALATKIRDMLPRAMLAKSCEPKRSHVLEGAAGIAAPLATATEDVPYYR